MTGRVWWLWVGFAVVAGCDPPDGGDSPRLGDPEVLQLELVHVLDDEFGRIADVAVSESGMVFVADQQARHVQAYREDGSRVATVGRPGGGPGEFRYLSDIDVIGDTLAALDHGSDRLTLFPPPIGESSASPITIRLERTSRGGPRIQAVPVPGGLYTIMGRSGVSGDTVRSDLDVLRWLSRSNRADRDSVIAVVGIQWLIGRFGTGHIVLSMPFGARTFLVKPNDSLLVELQSNRLEARVLDTEGNHVSRVALRTGPRRPVRQGDVEAYAETVTSDVPIIDQARREVIMRAFEEGRLPGTYPWFVGAAASDDVIWIQSFGADGLLTPGTYGPEYHADEADVVRYDLSGRPTGRLTVHGRVRLVASWATRLYFVTIDQNGVERVAVYRVLGGS